MEFHTLLIIQVVDAFICVYITRQQKNLENSGEKFLQIHSYRR